MTVNWDDKSIVSRLNKSIMTAIVRGTESVRNEAIRLVQQPPKTGRIYKRRGVQHQASAPGEAPASDTGRLVNSITTSYDAENLSGKVNASTEYAVYLEYGTQKIEPRPFMRPALASKRAQIEIDVTRAIVKEFGK